MKSKKYTHKYCNFQILTDEKINWDISNDAFSNGNFYTSQENMDLNNSLHDSRKWKCPYKSVNKKPRSARPQASESLPK